MMIREMMEDREEIDNTSSRVAVEIAHYLTSPVPSPSYNILSFWKQNEKLFLILSQLARVHLSASSTSVPVESMFSITGLIANSRRSALGAEKLHRISFIHDNYEFVKL